MSSELWIKYDVREGNTASSADMCKAAIEQAVWAENNGFDAILFGEHHGTTDGYLPSPIVLAAAVAARTSRIRIHLGALLLPFHNPIRLAEDLCVLDNISQGRLEFTVGVGYVPTEFHMFGVDLKDRRCLVEESIRVLKSAFNNETFEYQGRRIRVSPPPAQPGGPRMIVGGGLKATATRAAQWGDGFFPSLTSPELIDFYRSECRRFGRPVGQVIDITGSGSFHVSNDPERDWPRVGPCMMHEINTYAEWAGQGLGGAKNYMKGAEDYSGLKENGAFVVVTPDECLALFNKLRDEGRIIMLNPLCGGLDPDIAWESLELMASDVLPRYKHKPVRIA